MRRLLLSGFIAVLFVGILLIGFWWTKATPVVPATPPDPASAPIQR
ncbi:hypothetical protein [Methylobacterium persicinum]|nr:hypothetical protein [Methylobacterium persicinum]